MYLLSNIELTIKLFQCLQFKYFKGKLAFSIASINKNKCVVRNFIVSCLRVCERDKESDKITCGEFF